MQTDRPYFRGSLLFILVVACAGVPACDNSPPPRPAANSAAPSAKPLNKGADHGVSFSGPKAWRELAPDKEKTIGWYVSAEKSGGQPAAMIMIDTGTPVDSGLTEAAKHFAQSWNGQLLEEPTDLDGEPARRVRAENKSAGVAPVEGIMAIRSGKLFAIMGGTIAGRSVQAEVEEVRKSWKWLK